MYYQIEGHLGRVFGGNATDGRIVQEIASYFQENLEADELTPELAKEAETLYNYLWTGRAIFANNR